MALHVTIKDYLFESQLFMQRSVQALFIAALLTAQGVRGLNVYRTLIFIPTTLSVVI